MKDWKGIATTLLLTIVLLLTYYSYLIINADKIGYGQWGDGYKNYYTPTYYLKYDNGAHFSGMNYPFGENVIFTDNQPAVAWALKPLAALFPGITNHMHGIITWLLYLSFLIAALFTYKTLRVMQAPWLIASVFSALIILLSPQVIRQHNHYSLGYACYLPMLLYLLVKYFKSEGAFKFLLFLILLITLFTFIHVYYLALGGMFIMLVALLFFLANIKQARNYVRFCGLLVIAVIIPFIALKSYLLVTDKIDDRPQAPWGFVESRATTADILSHPYTFTYGIAKKVLVSAQLESLTDEGISYIGLVSIITLVVFLILLATSVWRKNDFTAYIYPFNYFIIPATLVLLFAMALPFAIKGLESYYTLLPGPLKQFRAAGRFSWVFYYVSTTFTAVLLSHLLMAWKDRKNILAYGIVITAIAIWFTEVSMISKGYYNFFKSDSHLVKDEESPLRLNAALAKLGYSTQNFQAIFPLPYYHTGSEKLAKESGALYTSIRTSIATGLPIICGSLSRTSESQSFEMTNLLGDTLVKKSILNKYHSQKPLLLEVVDNELSPEETTLLNKGKFLFELDEAKYYELPLTAFSDSTASVKTWFKTNKPGLIKHDSYLSNRNETDVVLLNFEDGTSYNHFGIFNGGVKSSEKGDVYIFDSALPGAGDSIQYEFSMWVYSDKRRAGLPLVYFSQNDTAGRQIESVIIGPGSSHTTFGKWVQVKHNFILKNKTNHINIAAQGYYAAYDEMMIRPVNETVISGIQNDSTFLFNNKPIQ